MSASAASWSTSSQPSSTIGAMTIASTPWLMKLRTALIWAAGSLSAALKTRSKPFSFENAVLHGLGVRAAPPRLGAGLREADLDQRRRRSPLPPSLAESGESLEPQPAAKSAKAPIRAIPVRNFVFTPNLLVRTDGWAGSVVGDTRSRDALFREC